MRFWAVIPAFLTASAALGDPGGAADTDAEIRSIASGVLADASTRSGLAARVGVEHDGTSFFLRTEDKEFSLKLLGEFQFRYTADFRRGTDEPDQSGFEVRRLRLHAMGHVGVLDYRVQVGMRRNDGAAIVEFAYGRYKGDDWSVQWGQFKPPLLREELVTARMQLAADRSLVNEIFTAGFSQGVQVGVEGDRWRAMAMFSDGANAARTDVASVRPAPLEDGGESDWALTGRVEWLGVGDSWELFRDFTGVPGTEAALMVGAAMHAEAGDSLDPGDYSVLEATIDLSLKGDGWNAFGYGVWRRLDAEDADAFDDLGFVVQGGAFVPETDWELFARYDVYVPDPDSEGDAPFSTLTFGTNWYLHGHGAKLTLDVQWFLDDADGTDFRTLTRATGIGFFGSEEPGEVALRAQFQLLF